MNSSKFLFSSLLASVLVTGCASHLQVTEISNGTEKVVKGIPVTVPALVKFKETTSYESSKVGFTCHPTIVIKEQLLPGAKQIYINFDPAPLGKSEFSLELSDNGNLKSVSLNSDAAAAAEQVAGLLDAVVPYFEAKKEPSKAGAAAVSSTAQEEFDKNCVKKEVVMERI